MHNLGPKSTQRLASVGIHTLDDLREAGVITAYKLVKAHGYNASLNLLWALQGAAMNVHWTKIPAEVKQDLKRRLKEDASAKSPFELAEELGLAGALESAPASGRDHSTYLKSKLRGKPGKRSLRLR